MPKRVLAVLLIVLALVAAGCGGRSDDTEDASGGDDAADDAAADDTGDDDVAGDDAAADDTAGDDTDDVEEEDPCEGVTLEATDTGVSEDTITVVSMADVESPLAQGLFEGVWLGADAWAEHVNAEGGIACRQVVVEQWDSLLSAQEATNGFLKACDEALAMVGTNALFATDVSDLNSCTDADGNPIGVPDLAYITTEVPHQCSENSFHISRPGAVCPYESGERDFTAQAGPVQWALDNVNPDLHGIFIVPGDLPSTRASAVPQTVAHEEIGVVYDDVVPVSGSATQAEYAPLVQTMRENGSTFVYNGSNDQAMLKFRSEAAAQGLDDDSIVWMCSLSCYTPDFIEQGGDVVEGTYVWMSFVPFENTDANEELADFIEAIDDPFPAAWAAGAWASGALLEQVVADIVATEGPNGVTRQAVLDGLAEVDSFDANGWWAPIDLTTTNTIADCIVILQVQDGEFVQVYPDAQGELACPGTTVEVTADPAALGE